MGDTIVDKLSVFAEEAAHARDALSRTVGTIYTLYGIIIPAVIGALTLFGKDALGPDRMDILGFVIIVVTSGALAYANALWMEAHQYLRYLYLELFPRMYEEINATDKKNFFQYQACERDPYTFRPIYLFQAILVVGVSTLGIGAIVMNMSSDDWRPKVLLVLAIVSIIAAVYPSLLMQKSAKDLIKELKESTDQNANASGNRGITS